MEFPGGGGSTARPSGTENPGGWGGQTGKTLRGGGMDIFWNHTMSILQAFFATTDSRLGSSLTTVIHQFNGIKTCFSQPIIFIVILKICLGVVLLWKTEIFVLLSRHVHCLWSW